MCGQQCRHHAAIPKGITYCVKQNHGHLHWTASLTSVETVQTLVKYRGMGKATYAAGYFDLCIWPNCTANCPWPHAEGLRLRLVCVCRPQRRSRQAHGNNHAGDAGGGAAAAAAGPSTAAGQAARSPDDLLVHQLMLLLTSAHRGFTSHEAMVQATGNVVVAAVRAANQANAERHPAGSQPPVPRQPTSYSPSDPILRPPRSAPLPEPDSLLLGSFLLGVTAAQAPDTLRPPSDVSGSQGSHTASVLPNGAAAPVGPVPSLGRGRGEARGRGRGVSHHRWGRQQLQQQASPLISLWLLFPPWVINHPEVLHGALGLLLRAPLHSPRPIS